MTEELEQLLKNLKLRRMLEIYDEQLRPPPQPCFAAPALCVYVWAARRAPAALTGVRRGRRRSAAGGRRLRGTGADTKALTFPPACRRKVSEGEPCSNRCPMPKIRHRINVY
jgi:hypothetical protein